MLEKYNAFLFDMDGTLVDSEPLKGKALAQSCKYFGGNVSAEVYKDIMGESIEMVAQYFFQKAAISPDINIFLTKFKETYKELLDGNAQLIPGVQKFIEALSLRNVKIGMVSSAYKWMVNNVLQQINMIDKFDVIISQEDVEKHKPDPQAYMLAVKRLGVKASETLVFEDSTAGLTAASSAGCDIIAVIHDFNPTHDFSKSILCIRNYHELMKKIKERK